MKTAIKQLSRNESVVTTDIQNELLIFDPVTKVAHVLNSTGKLIWNGIAALIDNEAIAEVLKAFPGAEGFDVDGETDEFIDKLEEAGLLIPGSTFTDSAFSLTTPPAYSYTSPKVDTYSEEFLREHLKDVSFATFHDDTYNDLGTA